MQETQTTPNVETSLPTAEAPAPAPVEEPTVKPDAEAPVETESTEEVTTPLSFDEWWEGQSKDNEALRSSYDLKLEEIRETGRREAQSQLQPKLDRMHQTFQNYQNQAGQIAQGINGIREEIGTWLSENGVDQRGIDKVFQSLYQKNPALWGGLNDLTGRAGGFNTLRGVAVTLGGEIGGDAGKTFGEKYLQEFSNAEGGVGTAVDVIKEMMSDWDTARLEKAVSPYKKRIAALEAELERGKVAGRQNGPDNAPKGVGGRTYSQMSPDERNKLTPQQRDALVKQEMGWQ